MGHSRGGAMITGPIGQQIDGEQAREQIVSALILGAPIMVPPGRDVGRSPDRRPGRPVHPDHRCGSELGPSPHRRRSFDGSAHRHRRQTEQRLSSGASGPRPPPVSVTASRGSRVVCLT
ncbi:hypothetical protein [Brevundimonas sp. SL161]|uniref:hypothetical protein n=1 Tax=Brevundimonas sp. SL161 TaxID=2804613 RepID=UPI003CEDEBA3